MKAENPQLNVSEVSFARRKAGKNSFEKWCHASQLSNPHRRFPEYDPSAKTFHD
jgi:hypothetical protein